MSWSHGNGDEMGNQDHGLSIEEADHLLGGRVPAGRGDLAGLATDLVSLSAAYRHEVDAVDIRRWAVKAAAHARLIPSDKGDLAATPASNAHRPAEQVSGLPKRRTPVLSSIAAFLATTVGKTVAAGALVAATTTGGLAATGNLPGQPDGPDPAITIAHDTHETDDADDAGDIDDEGIVETDDVCAGLDDAAEDACEDASDASAEDADDGACDDADDAEHADEVDSVDDADEADDDACDDADDADDADEVDSVDDADEVDSVDDADES